jgi:acyl-CoA dehydrogenase
MDFTIPEELRLMRETVRRFIEQEVDPISNEIDENDEIPEHIVETMRGLGLFGLAFPEEYGGLGLGMLGECMVVEELSRGNQCLRTRIGTNNGVGGLSILYDGTEEQKKKYLADITSGRKTIAFGLTEPDAGSDASAIKTFAERRGDRFIVNGTKIFITNGAVSDLVTTIVLTDREKRARGGMTALLVEKGTKGFSVGKHEKKMGLRGSTTTELIFEDCEVPVENVIGGEIMIGQGFKTAMRVLDKSRLTMAAGCVGTAQKALELAVRYAKERVQFGKPIGHFQLVQDMLARMATNIYAGRAMAYQAAWEKDQGKSVVKEAAMAKLYCTEMLDRVVDMALQIHGGMGFMKEFPIERMYRDARICRIYEGSSEIQKIIIARELLKE